MKPKHELMSLKNLGQATYQDLTRLGITSIADLAKADPDELYRRIQETLPAVLSTMGFDS
jgi:nucleotidyltransferase/DNA polymerase involved in DNA repair